MSGLQEVGFGDSERGPRAARLVELNLGHFHLQLVELNLGRRVVVVVVLTRVKPVEVVAVVVGIWL